MPEETITNIQTLDLDLPFHLQKYIRYFLKSDLNKLLSDYHVSRLLYVSLAFVKVSLLTFIFNIQVYKPK